MSTKTLHITDESQSVTKTIVLVAWPVFLEQIFTTLVRSVYKELHADRETGC